MVQDLKDLIAGVESSQAEIQALTAELREIKDLLTKERAFTKRLREKCKALEKPASMDGWDEQWCWDMQATIKFKKSLTGGCTLTIQPRSGRRVVLTSRATNELPSLSAALEAASGRKRVH